MPPLTGPVANPTGGPKPPKPTGGKPSSSGPGGFVVQEPARPGGGGGGGSTSGMSSNSAVLAILRNHKKWKQYMPIINSLASEYNVDRVFLLAALVAADVTPANIARFSQRFADAMHRYGSLDDAYRAVAPAKPGSTKPYGPKGLTRPARATMPSKLVPNRYVSGGIGYTAGSGLTRGSSGGGGGGGGGRAPKMTPEEQVHQSIYKIQLKKALTDPWVVIKNGKLKLVKTLNPPKGSLGIRYSEFMAEWEKLNDAFEAYIGRKAKAGEVALILKKGWSDYTIVNNLSKRPNFFKSRIFKAEAPGYESVALDILGDAWNGIQPKNRNELLRQAIVNQWTQATFAERLRRLPAYLKGVEFQSNVATLRSVYEDIYGIAGADSLTRIEEAALARWTPQQFASHLRGLPGYTSSQEFQGRALAVLEALGMITGQLPGLVPGSPMPNPAAPGPNIPNSPRIPGAAQSVRPTLPTGNMVPTLVSP